jgi:two-component system, NarL family, nitrate/nitrite response regulator NarL
MTLNVGELRGTQRYQSPPHAISVLIVEENTIFRAGLAAVLDGQSGILVAGEVARPIDAPHEVLVHRPDIVLLGSDSLCPETEQLATQIMDSECHPSLIVLGLHDDVRVMRRLVNLGVRAYLPKDVPHQYLVSVIYMTCLNDHRTVTSRFAPVVNGTKALSLRELEVIGLVAQAMTNAQIGRLLRITEGTVKRHVRSIFVKLHAVSRMDAVNKAMAAHLIE